MLDLDEKPADLNDKPATLTRKEARAIIRRSKYKHASAAILEKIVSATTRRWCSDNAEIQIVTSTTRLSSSTKVSPEQVRRVLSQLQKDKVLELERFNRRGHIIISAESSSPCSRR
jgi:hypothetical protein